MTSRTCSSTTACCPAAIAEPAKAAARRGSSLRKHRVGEDESDEIGAFGRVRHRWLLRWDEGSLQAPTYGIVAVAPEELSAL